MSRADAGTTPVDQIDAFALTARAHAILVEHLEACGNLLSDMHRAALYELVEAFAKYSTGQAGGRRAYALPCGGGKTSAIVAFVAAAHRMGYCIPIAVAASRVEALCALKRDLLEHGVPASWIGLKHSLLEAASEPSTADESRLVALVSHARVKRGNDQALVGMFEGEARRLIVWDESLLRAECFAINVGFLGTGVAALEDVTRAYADPLTRRLTGYLRGSVDRIRGALADIKKHGDPEGIGAAVELDELDESLAGALLDHLGTFRRNLRGFGTELRTLLEVSQETLRIVATDQGEGIVTAREVIPPELRNIVILDASAPIRELARLDPTIKVMETFDSADLKSYEQVQVRQLLSPGGRSSIEQSMRAERHEAAALVREVAAIVKDGWTTERAFLIFTFVHREGGEPNMEDALRNGLRRLGIDTEAKTNEGLPRLNWLQWGSETSTNGLEHATSVIMAGVLHRGHLDLTAAVRGQTGNPAEPTPGARIRALIESELAHCILQGASRGSCRRIANGKAHAMRLTFVHKDPGIKAILDQVMPGAVWSYPEPQYLKRAATETRAARLLGQLLAHLATLPDGVEKVSSRALKQALDLNKDAGTEKAFSQAVGLLELPRHGWTLLGRSVARGAALHGFTAQASLAGCPSLSKAPLR